MASLFCQAATCMHNKAGSCGANNIQVSNAQSETFCDTYTASDSFVASEDNYVQYTTLVSRTDSEFGEDFENPPRITCNVGACMHNQSFRCNAGDVQIGQPHHGMKCNCKTYRTK